LTIAWRGVGRPDADRGERFGGHRAGHERAFGTTGQVAQGFRGEPRTPFVRPARGPADGEAARIAADGASSARARAAIFSSFGRQSALFCALTLTDSLL
jgi:hypothetical protein